MNFYIATKLENARKARDLATILKSWGWYQTYDWTVHGRVYGENSLGTVALNELNGVSSADLVILLLPGEKGTHTELGVALGKRVKVVIHSEDPAFFNPYDQKTCSFYWDPSVERVVCPFSDLAFWLKKNFGEEHRRQNTSCTVVS